MLFEVSVIPVGGDTHMSDELGDVLSVIDRSGLPYQLGPASTCIEAEWDEAIALVRDCHREARRTSPPAPPRRGRSPGDRATGNPRGRAGPAPERESDMPRIAADRTTFPCRAGAARRLRGAALAVLLVLAGGPLFADTLLTGFAGVAFGGTTVKSHGSYGGALGFLGHGPVGFEIEFGVTPDFFGESTGVIFTSNNVVTGMASLLLATPGAVRIYVAGGGGLMKTRLEDPDQLVSINKNDFGINVGGGLLVSLGDHLALRGDIRYFRDLENTEPGGLDLDLGHVDYWRGVGGLTLKF